ncbi:O-unit flippase-like protein [Pedobacter frigidisoli]|uniref:O-unit flippase-like protein n=1 Tax=Pedobacter frigidisoli TaxID=2530455 RepID=UPI00292CE10C|nr:O-unit flippase-like protein [Pedobacter frigidisoli]
MHIKISKVDVVWSYLAQMLNYGAGLLLLPIILHTLPTSHLAIWYIFLAINAAINLLDFGFQPNLMRNMSYVMAGAKRLSSGTIDNFDTSPTINWPLFWSLVYTAKKIYQLISVIVFVILITLGTYYIYSVTSNLPDQSYLVECWVLYLSISVINFYYYYFNPLLLGRGLVKEYNLVVIITKSTNLILSFVALQFGLGLMGIVLALFLSTIVDRYFAGKYFYHELNNNKYNRSELTNLFHVLWGNSWRLGIVTLGTFFILRANLFLVSKYLSLAEAASYGLSLQLVTTLVSFGTIFFTAHIPKINMDRLKSNNDQIKTVVGQSLLISWVLYIIGAAFLIFFGNIALSLIHSKTELIAQSNLIFLCIILFLEMNHSLFATLITTKNTVPFVKPAIISGVLVVLFSYISLQFLALGMFGVLSSQFIVQAAYNNWKWPYVSLKDLNSNLLQLVISPFTNKKK